MARHRGRPEYRAHEAEQRAWDFALPPKRCLLAIHVKLRNVVARKLIQDWSPEQISGWLRIRYSDAESMRVSHETIYVPVSGLPETGLMGGFARRGERA